MWRVQQYKKVHRATLKERATLKPGRNREEGVRASAGARASAGLMVRSPEPASCMPWRGKRAQRATRGGGRSTLDFRESDFAARRRGCGHQTECTSDNLL